MAGVETSIQRQGRRLVGHSALRVHPATGFQMSYRSHQSGTGTDTPFFV